MKNIYGIYQNTKELNYTGVHEIEIGAYSLETVHSYQGRDWQLVGEISTELDIGELQLGLTARQTEALMDAENSLDIIYKYIKDWSDRDMERKYG